MASVVPNHINVCLIRANDRKMVWQYSWLGDDPTKWTGLHENDSKGHTWFHSPVSIATTAEHYSLFLVAEDKCLYQANFDLNDTGDYSPWVKVAGTMAAPPAVAYDNGVVHIVFVGIDGGLHYKTWTFKGGVYNPTGDVSSKLADGFDGAISPAVVITGGKISVFAVHKHEQSLHVHDVGKQHNSHHSNALPGRWTGGLKAVSLKPGEWDVCGISPEGHINHLRCRTGGRIQLEEMREVQVIGTDAILSKDGKIELFATTRTHEVRHRTLQNDKWNPWDIVGGTIVTLPRAVAHTAGSLAVFGLGGNAVAYGNVRNRATGKWSGWFALPQATGLTECVG
ncbi:hypothetical protein M422DRAFT_257162 [Sphaerobolus stellatus SS14]|uniref:Unplaced genomic scaffold SPHSTscaffold_72, whole genome shotgun sequence n=1 Tax=Sphaerobolus stellatus (strain SS14) TaxID=990650 RepID=A0A0C9VQC0_SPHS4|nr:hypothetical protein M422DRAFT_257162 [Sphaerobolus stellatus SS14]